MGIKPGDVRRAEATLLQGIQVGSVFQEQKVFDVVVQGRPATRAQPRRRPQPADRHARRRSRAARRRRRRARRADRRPSIERDAVSRRLDVEADVSGRSARRRRRRRRGRASRSVSLPLEYHAEVLSEPTSEEINSTRMLGVRASRRAIALFLLLQAAFRSWRLAAAGVPRRCRSRSSAACSQR